jgi:hypothetical protein
MKASIAVHAALWVKGPSRSVQESPQLLSDGCREVRGLQALPLCFGTFEACCSVVGRIQAVSSALDGPDGHAIGCEYRASLCRKRHRA